MVGQVVCAYGWTGPNHLQVSGLTGRADSYYPPASEALYSLQDVFGCGPSKLSLRTHMNSRSSASPVLGNSRRDLVLKRVPFLIHLVKYHQLWFRSLFSQPRE